ncbi:MAG: helix-turn-helix domain-containing protein [Planctomycetota bacterium]|nr:MAG: helix-turn-helix domain-containing protein [Planctomycetota bacterium]
MNNPPEKLLSLKDICALVSLGERTARRWLTTGALPPPDARLAGKLLRWRASTIHEWVEKQACQHNGTH